MAEVEDENEDAIIVEGVDVDSDKNSPNRSSMDVLSDAKGSTANGSSVNPDTTGAEAEVATAVVGAN